MKFSTGAIKWFEKANWIYIKIYLQRLENQQKIRNKYDEINFKHVAENQIRYERDALYDTIVLKERKIYKKVKNSMK